jgi:hypothetical protein
MTNKERWIKAITQVDLELVKKLIVKVKERDHLADGLFQALELYVKCRYMNKERTDRLEIVKYLVGYGIELDEWVVSNVSSINEVYQALMRVKKLEDL